MAQKPPQRMPGEAGETTSANRHLWRRDQSRSRYTTPYGLSQTGRRGVQIEKEVSYLSRKVGRTEETTTIAMLIIIDRMFPIAIKGSIK